MCLNIVKAKVLLIWSSYTVKLKWNLIVCEYAVCWCYCSPLLHYNYAIWIRLTIRQFTVLFVFFYECKICIHTYRVIQFHLFEIDQTESWFLFRFYDRRRYGLLIIVIILSYLISSYLSTDCNLAYFVEFWLKSFTWFIDRYDSS